MSKAIESLNANTFDRIFSDYSKQVQPPQLIAGLISDNRITKLFSHGFEVGEMTTQATNTQFRIASMTKCFAAAMVLKLRDQGEIKLTDSVAKYIPVLKNGRWPQVTIFDLLTMQSGLPTDDPWGDRLLPCSNDELTAIYASELIFACERGHEFHYSNLGYMMVGRIISTITGISALKAIQNQILIPLGMHQTEWIPNGSDWLPGFTRHNSTLTEQPIDQAVNDGAVFAGLWSTISDLTIWITFLMNSSHEKATRYQNILSIASRQELQTGIITVNPPKSSGSVTEGFQYALGLRTFINRELNFVGHSGGLPGYGSHFRWHQNSQNGIIALANLTYADVSRPCQEALRMAVLNQQTSCKEVPSLVQQRSEQLFKYFNNEMLEKDLELFALNFFKDNPWDSFQKDFKQLLDVFSTATWADIIILPEPGLGARVLVKDKIICSFSLSPGEGGKIQELIKIG